MMAAQSVLRVGQLTSLPHNCGAHVMQVMRVFQNIKSCSFVRRKCFVLENQRCLACKVSCRPTQRAPDVWESARFMSIFLASGFSYISNIVHARPHAGNANRWKAEQRANAKPSLNCKFGFSFVSKRKFAF